MRLFTAAYPGVTFVTASAFLAASARVVRFFNYNLPRKNQPARVHSLFCGTPRHARFVTERLEKYTGRLAPMPLQMRRSIAAYRGATFLAASARAVRFFNYNLPPKNQPARVHSLFYGTPQHARFFAERLEKYTGRLAPMPLQNPPYGAHY